MEDSVMQEILSELKKGNEAFSSKFSAIDRKIAEYEKKIAEYEKNIEELKLTSVDLEKRVTYTDTLLKERPGISLPGVEDEKRRFSLTALIKAHLSGDWSEAGFEKEVITEAKRKALSTATDTAGGYLVPMELIGDIIELLKPQAVVMQAGATLMPNLVGNPAIPKRTSKSATFWLKPGATIGKTDFTFGMVRLFPKKIATLVPIDNELLKQTTNTVEGIVRQDIAEELGLAIDLAALRGSGVEGEPRGIANLSGINTVAIGADGGDFEWNHAIDMQTQLEANNALRGSLAYIMHPKVKNKMKKQRIPQFAGDTGGAYVVPPVISDAMLRDMLGFPFFATTQIPTDLAKGTGTNLSEVYFGNWADLVIGQWGGFEVLVSNVAGTAMETDQTWIRILALVDIVARIPASFCLISDAKTT